MNRWILGTLLLVLLWAGCEKKTIKSPIPTIQFVSFSRDSVKAGYYKDTAYLVFNYSDGDADLGSDQTGGSGDIFLKDSRDGKDYPFYFPEIDPQARNADYGMEGTVQLGIQAALLTPRQDSIHMTVGDTVIFDVYVKDQAGHESNHFKTPRLVIKP